MKNWLILPIGIGVFFAYKALAKKQAIGALGFKPWYIKIKKAHWSDYLTNIPLEIGMKVINQTNEVLEFRGFQGSIAINNSPSSSLRFQPLNPVGIRAQSVEEIKASIDVSSINLLDILKSIWKGGLSAKAQVAGTLFFKGVSLPVSGEFPVLAS